MLLSQNILAILLCLVIAIQLYTMYENSLSQHESLIKKTHDGMSVRTLNETVTKLKDELTKRSSHALTKAVSSTAPVMITPASSTIHQPEMNTTHPLTPQKGKKAVLFTMDSMAGYERDSKKGGAAGEIMIRTCLSAAFAALGVRLTVITSDSQFNTVRGADYDIILLDPWTWAAPGWVPKKNIRAYQDKIYILDFFGSPKMRGSGLNVPQERILTAFGSPWNTALGYFLDESEFRIPSSSGHGRSQGSEPRERPRQGLIWGKDPKHFTPPVKRMLARVANTVPLIATSREKVFKHDNIDWKGHQTRTSWLRLLSESQFLIGLGNPLLGPSAIDAIASGSMYINPVYKKPMRNRFKSQHDFAVERLGEQYVCSYPEGDATAALKCIERALWSDRNSSVFIPTWFQRGEYIARVKQIFYL